MGQRLVFDVYRGRGEAGPYLICSINFQWSACTLACYQESKMLIEGLKRHNYNERMSDKETIQILIDTVQENIVEIPEMVIPGKNGEEPTYIPKRNSRGGILKDDIEFAKKEGYNFTEENVHYSYGLIAISRDGMASLREWAEALEDFYIDEQLVTNGLFYPLTYKDIQEEFGIDIGQVDDYNPPLKSVEEVYFEDIDKVIDWLKGFKNEWIIGRYMDGDVQYFMTTCT